MNTTKIPVRFSSVKPSPESIQRRGERVAEQHGGRYIETTPLRVGRSRSRSTVWDAEVVVEKYDSKSYQRGWATSERGTEGALDSADRRGEPEEWYQGYMDHATDRPKWFYRDASAAEKRAHGLA